MGNWLDRWTTRGIGRTSATGSTKHARCEPPSAAFSKTEADRERSDLDAAEQIVGELLANAVRHGAPPFGVCIDWDDDPPTLCIVDRGPGMPPLYAVPEPQSERGRGLLLVRALAGDLLVDSPTRAAAAARGSSSPCRSRRSNHGRAA